MPSVSSHRAARPQASRPPRAARHPTPRLRLAPRPSRIGCVWVLLVCLFSTALLALMPLPLVVWLPCAVVILAVLVGGLWRSTGRGVPALMHVGNDRRMTVTDYEGRAHAGTIHDDTFVGAWLTTIVWRRDGHPWWRPAPVILVLPDTLSREDFRRLRVALRYGRPAPRGPTSGNDAV